MSKMQPNELTELDVEEVSSVNRGANQHAKVILLKRVCDMINPKDDSRTSILTNLAKHLGIGKQEGSKLIIETAEEDPMGEEDTKALQKTIDSQATIIAKLEAKDDIRSAVSKALADIAKAADAAGVDAVVVAAKAAAQQTKTAKAITDNSLDMFLANDVNKVLDDAATVRKAALQASTQTAELKKFRAALPEPMQKAFDAMDPAAQEAYVKSMSGTEKDKDPLAGELKKALDANASLTTRLDKMEGEQEIAKASAELDDLKGVVPEFQKFVTSVVALRKTDAELANQMVANYRSMAKQKGTNLFASFGKSSGEVLEATDKINKAIANYRKENPNCSNDADAMTKVMEQNPSLYDEYMAGHPSQAGAH